MSDMEFGYESDLGIFSGGREDQIEFDYSTDVSRDGNAYKNHHIGISIQWDVDLFDSNHILYYSSRYFNLITDKGLNQFLDEVLGAGVHATYFIGLVDATGSPIYDPTDDNSVHAGWTEWIAYDELARQEFIAGTAANGVIDNSASRAVFTINADGTLDGTFLVADDVKGGIGIATIMGEGQLNNGPQAIRSGDIAKVTTTIRAQRL